MDAVTPDIISELLLSHLHGTLSEAEEMTLQSWIAKDPSHAVLVEKLDDAAGLSALLREHVNVDEALDQQLAAAIPSLASLVLAHESSVLAAPEQTVSTAHRVHFLKIAWFRYAAAIIILFGVGAYLWNNYNAKPSSTTATIEPSSSDILPGGQKAKLTLADGREIILDSAANGQIAVENGSEVIKRGGEIIYDAGHHRNEAVVYNTMSTPKGGQYQLTLPDGTKVWLNAASQIIYPTRFIGKTREVKVEGEVYFDIKANKNQPFIVKTTSDEIKVLGTEFNVNNYPDEPASKISLINGAVKVNNQLLQPGQAFVNGKIMQTNIEQDVAWRKGYFSFKDADIKSLMRQLARWYDVEVVYEGVVPDVRFAGKLPRDANASQILRILQKNDIHLRIAGNKIIVTP